MLVDDSRRASAQAWLRRDAKYIYVGFRRDATLKDGKAIPWTMDTTGENAPAWRDDSLKVRVQQDEQYEYIFLSASGARTTGRSDRRWKMIRTEEKTGWQSAAHATAQAWTAEMAVPIHGAPKTLKVFLESFNRTGIGDERAFYKFRSWRRWFVSGGEADVAFASPPTPDERSFTVRLHFCELENVQAGDRVFDVRIQGKDVIKALDVVSAAGGTGGPLVKEFKSTTATDTINMQLVPAKGSKLPAILCGAEIVEE